MTALTRQPPAPGQLVEVRQRRYAVANVRFGARRPLVIYEQGLFFVRSHVVNENQSYHIVTLTSVEDDALGEELEVIWELEPGALIVEEHALPEVDRFDPPKRLDTFLNAVRWGAIASVDTQALQAPFRSGIELEEYQLDPVVRAIEMPRVNLLIADDVGLGKTIEAGLVTLELLLRHRARQVLIVCPASLQMQWRDQMRDKFGLEFRILDSERMRRLRRERGLYVNPWTHFPRLITSIDFLKRERLLNLFREAVEAQREELAEEARQAQAQQREAEKRSGRDGRKQEQKRATPVYRRPFDLLIVDEAHNVAPAGRGLYATDSQRTRALRLIAPYFEHKIFLSATPHNGYPESFTALLELLDPQRFARGVPPNPKLLHQVMVRRLKSDLLAWDGAPRFPRRRLEPLVVSYTQEERHLHRLLQEYGRRRLERTQESEERFAAEFVLKLLKKRLFSSPQAFELTLRQHRETLAGRSASASPRPAVRGRQKTSVLRRQLEDLEEESDNDEELEEARQEAIEEASRVLSLPTPEEWHLLDELLTLAERASSHADSKAQVLINWLRQTLCPNGPTAWRDERVIIFTEYRATQKWLYDLLNRAGLNGAGRLLLLYGGMPLAEREQVKAAFQADPRQSPVRILLATDAASEGIDLQNYCHRLVHYEIPWNPMRLEQRNGRVDRHGQRAPEVNIYHFVSSKYRDVPPGALESFEVGELEDDLEFLAHTLRRVEAIRTDLGKVGPVIAEQVEEAMLGRRRSLDTRQAEREAAPLRALLKQQERLEERVRLLHDRLLQSKQELQITPENVRAAVEVALELAKQPPLQPVEVRDPAGKRPPLQAFAVPSLSGSWAASKEGLAHPFTGQERPLVFDHGQARQRDDVVLAHLNHRLVAMSLRLLRAEVWSSGERRKLARVTARLARAPLSAPPVVVAHARLVLLGGDSQRLHEELLIAGGELRQGRLIPLPAAQLEHWLSLGTDALAPESVRLRLQQLWPACQEPLRQALVSRMQERLNELRRVLSERERKEMKDMRMILHELRRSIEQELAQPSVTQLSLFSKSEYEEYERNYAALRRRLEQIDQELEQELTLIRYRFENPQSRLFPVALTFLIPEHLAS
uniref:Helicase SNF2 family protein n=1 Tax=Thermogemmatispora argillosa TaxID=2045280 RepID=A0A455T1M1_9CHLR|nr:helicase SNF2 family protein [Thermogemmatispora argillosa]